MRGQFEFIVPSGDRRAFRVAFVPYAEGDDSKPAGERAFITCRKCSRS